MNPQDRLIIALDVDSRERAQRLVDELRPHAGMFKVGKELRMRVNGGVDSEG